MDTNQEEFNGLDDLNVQNVNEEEVTVPKTRSFLKGAILAKGSNDGQESGTEGTDGETVQTRGANDDPEPAPAEHDPPVPTRSSNGPVSIISDKLGQDHPIHAKQLEDTKTVTLTGDVTGTGHWNFAGAQTMDTEISENAVTNRELAANSVVGAAGGSSGSSQKSNIVQGSIGLSDINSGAIDTTVAAGSSNLVTSGAVQTAINNAVSGRGTTYGPMTVTEINALQNVNDGSTVHVSGQGTGGSWVINDGISDTGVAGAITVRDKSDLRYMDNDTKHGWYSLDGEFKQQQNPVADPQVPSSGTTESISFIDSITQNENGDINPSKKNVRQASTSQTGVVQLTSATNSDSETLAATAKAVKTVKDATDLLSSGKKDKQTPITGNQGSTAKTLTGIAQNENGVITPTFENIQSANASQPGLMSAADYSKLDALPTKSDLDTALAGKKDDQTPVDTNSASGDGKGGSLRTLTRLQQNANGDITATFADIPEAVATVGTTVGSKGLMSESDKTKLDAVKPGATKVEASETNGNIKIDGVETNVYTHPSAGATSHGSKGDTQNQTPGFGETFKSISATVDTDGHTTALGEHTVKIPDALATPSTGGTGGTKGLMSAADKEKLNGIAAGAEVNQNAFSNVTVGNTTVSAGSKTDSFELVEGDGIDITADSSTKKITIKTEAAPGTATPGNVTTGNAVVGTSTKFAHEDHVHHIEVGEGTATGTVSIAGTNVPVKDFGNKADKVSTATTDNFAAFDANGNLKDSGHKHSDYKTKQNAVNDPSTSGTGLEFISGISQDANGVISPSKKTVQDGTTLQKGVVQLQDSIGASESSSTTAATPKSVRDAINALDVNSAGGDGKYIKSISEVDGKIIPVAETADTTPTQNSTKMITSGGVYSAIDGLDATVTSSDGTNVQVKVTETNGKVSAVNITTDKTEDKNNKVTAITDANKASTTNYPSVKATVDFVNSSVATNTATFLGTFSAETDLGVTDPITDNKIIEKLATVHPWRHQPAQEGEKTEDNNDYVYVSVEDSEAHGYDIYKRFKYDGTEWKFEYELNHSSFTEAQWAAIVSGITSTKVGNYDAHLANTNNPHSVTKAQVGLGSVVNTGDSAIPVEGGTTKFTTGGAYTELAKKQNNLHTQTAYTAKGSATKVPQITTNTLGQVTGITEVEITGVTPAAHTHGNITNDGKLQTTDAAIGNGDKLVITDATDSNKVARSSVSFDGSTTTKALTPKGTWETFLQSHQDISGKADWTDTVTKVQVDSNGTKLQYVKGQPGGTQTTTDFAELDGTYNASSNKIATKSTVTNAINDLDSTKSGSSTHVSVTVKETDGKLESVTVTDTAAASDHVHGNITNDGKITGNGTAITNNSQLVYTTSDGSIVKSDIKFDGSTTNKALTQAGTWAEFNNNKAFANVKVGTTTVAADSSEDTLELVAGSGITLTPDAANDKVTVAHTNSVTAGTIGSSDASSGVTLQVPYASYDANGHITGKGTHTHTIPAATTSASGVTTLQDTIGASESTSNKAATPKAVRDAINELDVNSVGGDGKYIKSISEADGKIVPVEETMDTVPTEGSNKAATSGGIWSELDKKVNVDDMVAVTGRGTYDGTTHRLTFNDIIFDNIYPVVGKYGLAVFSENTAVNAAESSGDKEWLLDWRPYLIDMSAVQGETAKTPVAELKPGNWLRKTDGSYATVCGITSAQSIALDNKTVTWKASDANTDITSDITGAFDANGKFQPAVVWEWIKSNLSTVNEKASASYSCAIEVKLYVGAQAYEYGAYDNNHIPAPWETTETKYSVFIGRTSDVYVIDGVYSGTSTDTTNNSLYMRGLAAKPVPVGVDGFDPEFFRLRRTGISPGPSTVVSSKIRNFFYNYVTANSSNATVNGGQGNISVCYNNGTYPATNGPNQYRTVEWARGCNAGGANGSAVPVAEGGYHSLNAFLCSIEAAYKTRACFGLSTAFSTGNSSNDTCNSAETFRTNGGFELDGDGDTKYYFKFNANMKNTYGITNDAYVYNVVNSQYAHFQCMEPQIAASLAAEMGLAANTEFQWNGGSWHYEVPTLDGIKTLADNKMNCRIYKDIAFSNKTIGGKANCSGHVNLRCALAEGVNPVGDIWWYQGGGCEIVYETTGNGTTDYQYSFYLEPDQSRWISGTYVTSSSDEVHTNNSKFTAETQYKAVITDSTVGGTSNTYCLSRTGYSPLRKVAGGANTTGECCYQYRSISETGGYGTSGIRTRRLVLFRGSASGDYCSPRFLSSNSRPSSTIVTIGCAAQVLLA